MPAEVMDDSDPTHSRWATSAPDHRASDQVEVDVVQRCGDWQAQGVDGQMIARAADAALRAAGGVAAAGCEVTVLLTSDRQVQELNRTWRGQDRPTNVLSFPLPEEGSGPGERLVLGDVVLAFETVAEEARAKGLPLGDHVSHLVVHGVLHLLGHDHQGDAQAEHMEELERLAMSRLGLGDPYASEPELAGGEA